ncbi:MAG: hypothetical protein IKX23_09995 [Treponema sp.]|nr:hypothetical protein [Treponema sp.]
MGAAKKNLKSGKLGFNGPKKRFGINYWRFYFKGIQNNGGTECMFFIEFEMLNPWLYPSEPQLGFKPRIQIKEDDLQYALSGTSSAYELESEKIIQPSYVAVRAGRLDSCPKQITAYYPVKNCSFSTRPFEICAGPGIFTENELSGSLSLSEEECSKHPEYLCNAGEISWNLRYEVVKEFAEGFEDKTDKWFPAGIQTQISGLITIDGEDYVVDEKKSNGYMDRFIGKSFPEPWFHISSSNLQSLISGKTLFNSNFVVQGLFEDKLSFIGSFEGSDIILLADAPKRKYTSVWNCIESPEADENGDKTVHWSVSFNSKIWIIDIDITCKVKALYDRKLECPEGKRRILSIIQSGTGIGEIKLYKKIKNDLEQIEYARITNGICEFGNIEE